MLFRLISPHETTLVFPVALDRWWWTEMLFSCVIYSEAFVPTSGVPGVQNSRLITATAEVDFRSASGSAPLLDNVGVCR